MWLESFHQFLNRSLERLGDWARGVESLPARLLRRRATAPQESLAEPPVWDTPLTADAPPEDWQADFTYRFRSMHCRVHMRVLEPSPGMQLIYRALRGTDEA